MNQFGRDGHLSRTIEILTPAQIIDSELGKEEKLVWADIPISVSHHAQLGVPKLLFGVPFFGFAVFWTWGASSPLREGTETGITGFEYFFPMFGIPFLLVGLGMLLSPVWMTIKARKTVYALTNHRLIIREGFPRIKIKSWSLDRIGPLTRTGPAEGPGNLLFAEEMVQNNSKHLHNQKVGFVGIDQPKRLEDEIRKLLNR